MRGFLMTCALLMSACGDNRSGAQHDAGPGSDAANPSDAGIDTPDAPPDGPHQLTGCSDMTSSLIPRAPTDGLPCDLVPPGVTITVAQ
ncbi:MAG TPA: hypothetical protein VGM90_26620 [Kofleriaceae bacterium]|jgi:hypothetical protein